VTTYAQDEASVQDSDPRELITIEVNPPIGAVYRHTSGTEDVLHNGIVYKAIAIDRDELKTPMPEEDAEAQILIPIDHLLARRYPRQGVPPSQIVVAIQRLQVRSGEVQQLWKGLVTSMAADDVIARFLIPSRTMQALKKLLPQLGAMRACPHVVYSTRGCKVSESGSSPDGIPFKCSTTTINVAGRDVRLDLSNVPADNARRTDWLRFGKLVHVASGEQRSIVKQTDPNPGVSTVTDIQLFERIVEMKNGDAVLLLAGCDHVVTTGCRDKFGNRGNYGGMPHLPTTGNPFKLNNFGQYVLT
jgi:hypothetical protein